MPARMNAPRRMNAPQKSTMFPHTVTVYNVTMEQGPYLTEIPVNHITVLRGVFLEETKGYNVLKSGLENADSGRLYIPFDAEAADGITGTPVQYLPPVEYWRLENKTGYWTLSITNSKAKYGYCFLVKGEAVEPDADVQIIEGKYDGVYDITKIDRMDYGGNMAHFEVGLA